MPGRTITYRVAPCPSRGALALAVLVLGALALRLPLLALTAGSDLRVIAGLARRAAQGQDVYAIDVHRLTPWAYFPPLLDLFAGLARFAARTGWSFYVLAKAPVVAADIGVGVLLYAALRRRGHPWGRAATGAALYLYNPLVLYNGAFYGRFDAIALVFLLLALEGYRARLFAPAYALAIAAKTFPLFLLPLLALGRDRQPPRRLLLACGLVAPLSLPYVLTDPGGLLSHAFHTNRTGFGNLSWYLLVLHAPFVRPAQVVAFARIGLLLYPLVLVLLLRAPLYVKAACCYALFTVLTSTIYEQYLLWPLPFLVVVGLHHRRRGALALAALETVTGLVQNEYTWYAGPLHYAVLPRVYDPLNLLLAGATVAFVAAQSRAASLTGVGARLSTQAVPGDALRVYSVPASRDGQTVGLVLATSLHDVATAARALLALLVAGSLAVVLLAVLGGLALVRRGLRPLDEMAAVAEGITAR